MKKTLLFALCAIVAITAKTQNLPRDSATHKVMFSEVVKVDSATKSQLYTRCRVWFANTFVSANNVLQMDDKDAGQLIGHGSTKSYYKFKSLNWGYTLFYFISVKIKDNRYKFEIYDFVIQDNSSSVGTSPLVRAEMYNLDSDNEIMRGYKSGITEVANDIVSKLKMSMSDKAKGDDF